MAKGFNYIILVVNFYSYLQLLPFRLNWDKEQSSFSLEVTNFQKICCAFIHLNAMYTTLRFFLAPIFQYEEMTANLPKTFEIVDNLMSVVLLLYMIYFTWKRQTIFLKLFNSVYPFTHRAKWGTYLICLGFPLGNMIYRLIREGLHQIALTQGEIGADLIMNKMADLVDSVPSDTNDWSIALQIIHLLLKSVATLTYLLLFMFYLFQHAVIIVLLVGLKQTWDAYKVQIQRPGLPFEMGISVYSEIKRCVTLFNDLFTVPMLLIYLTNLTTFASLPQYLECKGCSGWEGPVTRIKVLIDVSYTMFIWLTSSQLHQEIQITMRAWIYSFHHHHTDYGIGKQVMITREDRMKLISFMAEVETDGLGVSCKFFTISYSTFGSMVGLMVTYGLVVYQFTNKLL